MICKERWPIPEHPDSRDICPVRLTSLCVCFQNKRVSINKDELKSTSKAVETVHNLCCNENKGASELVAELSTLYQCIR